MELGNFSVSLAVKDIEVSKLFYEKLGFTVFAGDLSQKWLIIAVNTNSTNTSGSNANANTGPSNTNQVVNPEIVHAQVGEMFASDKSTRIAATTRLIIEKKRDAATVQMSVRSALANPENKSGVINTLVYLENVDPAILKQNRAEIEKLLAVVKDNGGQTADHIRKVQSVLNK